MVLRLAQAVAQIENPKRKKRIQSAVDRVHKYSGDISNVIVRTREEMGNAAGMYFHNKADKDDIHFRDDLLFNDRALETTGHHEVEHRLNVVEGLAEKRANDLAGTKPSSELVDQVRAAEKIIALLGNEKTYELARHKEKGPILLEQELVKRELKDVLQFPKNPANAKRIAKAKKDAKILVNQATYYNGQAPASVQAA